jgi:hypothetical protein
MSFFKPIVLKITENVKKLLRRRRPTLFTTVYRLKD